MTDATKDTVLSLLKDYGFATVVALACLYVGRQDVLLPLVKAHAAFFGHVFEARCRDVNGEVFEVLPDVTEIGSRYAVILQRANEALFGFVLTWEGF